ncbi:hypothetical protein ACFQE0_26075 [Methylobacterium komagatae]|uniref:HIG1 domain-containing protein n=1 Tax=Methylobacterium komagatae TaxID=374425 RepID=A0ABW2BRX4_9HYPH
MAAQIVFLSLAVMCLFSAGFVGGLGWGVRASDGLLDRSVVRATATMLGLGLACLIAGAVA